MLEDSAVWQYIAALYGDLVHVTGYEGGSALQQQRVDVVLRDLALVPVGVIEQLRDAGLRGIYVGVGSVTDLDDLGFLRASVPIGWSPGSTYHDVPGVYVPATQVVAVAASGRSTGAVSLALHEIGHAVGDLLGLYLGAGLFLGHIRLAQSDRLSPYFLPAGSELARRELLAELFASVMISRELAIRDFDHEIVAWLVDALDLL